MKIKLLLYLLLIVLNFIHNKTILLVNVNNLIYHLEFTFTHENVYITIENFKSKVKYHYVSSFNKINNLLNSQWYFLLNSNPYFTIEEDESYNKAYLVYSSSSELKLEFVKEVNDKMEDKQDFICQSKSLNPDSCKSQLIKNQISDNDNDNDNDNDVNNSKNSQNRNYSYSTIDVESTIITSDKEYRFLEKIAYEGKQRLNLSHDFTFKGIEKIYDAKSNGDESYNFHYHCDNKGATITIIEDTNGNKFGGFTSKSWKSESEVVSDENAFLFSINKEKIIPVDIPEYAIYNNKIYGPTFGYGNDIRILSNCLSNSYNSSVLKSTYGFKDNSITNDYFTGNKYFKVANYEVFRFK